MRKSQFDLNLMRSLDALLNERNVTRAAEKLFVTQQAMSGSLRRLREHFGDAILTPVGRNLELTPLGRALIEPIRAALLSAELALDTQPHFDPQTARQNFRIAISDYATMVVIPRFLKRLSLEAPNIYCDVRGLHNSSLERLSKGELDLCITAGELNMFADFRQTSNIRQEAMFGDDFVCAADARHPTIGDKLTVGDYCTLGQIVTRLSGGTDTVVHHAWSDKKLQVRIVASAPSFSSLLFMLPGTPHLATAQRRLVNSLAPNLGLRILECPIKIKPLQETLVWHDRNDSSPGHRYVRTLLLEIAQEIDEESLQRA